MSVGLYSHVIKELHSGVCEVSFRKANGDLRVLKGTRNPEILNTNLGTIKLGAPIPVYDLEAGAWRSFKIERMIGIKRC